MFKNRTRLTVKGLNQERALNELSKEVKIYQYSRQEQDLCQFEVEPRHARHTKKLLESQGLEVLSLSHHGILSKIKKLLYRYGVIAGIVIVLLFYCLQYSFVWRVEVWGSSADNREQVQAFVKENMTSNFKSKIDLENLEILIRNNFDYVSSVSAAIVGQSLIVNLNEAVLPEEMEGQYNPIISEYDCQITEINLIQGTLLVNEGDIVQKGDVLVEPYIIDAEGNMRAVKPQADIKANVWLTGEATHYDYRIENVRTGKKVSTTEVLLGSLVLYQNNSDLPFKNYESTTRTRLLTKNNLLPLYLRVTDCYETNMVEIQEDFENVKDQVIEQARKNALIFLDKNAIIEDERYSCSSTGGCHIVKYVITASMNFGGTNEDQL